MTTPNDIVQILNNLADLLCNVWEKPITSYPNLYTENDQFKLTDSSIEIYHIYNSTNNLLFKPFVITYYRDYISISYKSTGKQIETRLRTNHNYNELIKFNCLDDLVYYYDNLITFVTYLTITNTKAAE